MVDLNPTFRENAHKVANILPKTHRVDGDIVCREVNPNKDFEVAYRIFKETIRESVETLNGGIWPEEERKPFFKKGFSDDGMMMLFHNEKPIGCFCITKLHLPFVTEKHLDLNDPVAMNEFNNRPTYEALILQRVYIDAEYQKHGIGNTLIDMALKQAHEEQIPLELEVLISNDAGLHAYGKKGYQTYAQLDSKGWNKKYLMRQQETQQYMPEAPKFTPTLEEKREHYL